MISAVKKLAFQAMGLLLSMVSTCALAQIGPKTFEVYQSMGFSGMPTNVFKYHNVGELALYGQGHLWVKNDPYYPNANIAQVQKQAMQSTKDQPRLVSLDVEHWLLDPKNLPASQQSIAKYVQIAKSFREKAPGVRFGFYGQLPLRDYWDPIRHSKGLSSDYAAWQKLNTAMQSIAAQVDVIMPSLYTFYKDDTAGWLIYAQENIKEARKYGKPVLVFLWPQYAPSTDSRLAQAEFISYDFWKLQLETVYDLADGVIIWTPKGIGQQWNESAPWWRATKDFLNEKRIGLAPTAPDTLKVQ